MLYWLSTFSFIQLLLSLTNMKIIFVFFICFVGLSQMANIVVHTGPQKVYSFFPLSYNCLKLNIRAESNIFIALSDSYSFDTTVHYEIGIGTNENTRSYVRKSPGRSMYEERKGAVVRNVTETYWINLNDCEGSITVGKYLSKFNTTLLRLTDPSYQKKSLFGISTGYGVSGDWSFTLDWMNCPISC